MTNISVFEYVESLTVDQLREARKLADRKIKKSEESSMRIVWQVVEGEICVLENFREEDYAQAADKLLSIFKERSLVDAECLLRHRSKEDVWGFCKEVPHIEPELVSEVEYYETYFPEDRERVETE